MTDDDKQARKNLTDEILLNEKVRYLIDGRRFDVPLGYHQWQRIKYGYWPQPRKDYTETTSTKMIDALLPDMKPFLESTKAQFSERVGHGDVITILVQSKEHKIRPISDILVDSYRIAEDQGVRAVPGFVRYVKKAYSAPDRDTYVLIDSDENERFIMDCHIPGARKSDSCRVSEYRYTYPGPISVTYDFSRNYLSQWREIREKVWSLVASFENTMDKQHQEGE